MARELTIRITANGQQAQQELAKTEQSVKGVENAGKSVDLTLAKMGMNIGQASLQAGQALALHVTAPMVALATTSVNTGTQFEKTLNQIRGVLTPTAADMEKVRQTALKMGADTIFTANDSAQAILELGKAGFTTADAMKATGEVLKLAAASGWDMQNSAEMAARTLKAFGLQVTDLSHVNDVLAKAVNTTSLELSDLQTAFHYVGPIAQGFGMSIEQVSAALGIMRDRGIAAETTGRALREGLDRLANPVKSVRDVLKDLGLEVGDLVGADGHLRNLSDLIGILHERGLTAEQSLKLFGNAAGPGMFALVKQGREGLDQLTGSLKDSEGAAGKMAAAMMTGLPGAFEQLKGSVETAEIGLSKALEPSLLAVLGAMTSIVNFINSDLIPAFNGLPTSVQTGIVIFGALLAALGPLLLSFGSLAIGVSGIITLWPGVVPVVAGVAEAFIGLVAGAGAAIVTFFTATLPEAFLAVIAFLGPQGLIALALIALGVVWYKWGDDITAVVKRVYEAIKTWLVDKFNEVVNAVKEKVHAITGFFADMYDKVVGHSYVPDMVDQIGQHFGRLDSVMVSPAQMASRAVEGVFASMGKSVTGIVGGMLDGIGGMLGGFLKNVLPGFIGSAMGMLAGLATEGIGALVNKARGGEEGVLVNPRRDAFLSQFGNPSDKGDTGAGHTLAALLTGFGAGSGGGAIFANLQNAESMVAFSAAADNIIKFLGEHDVHASRGFAQGTQGQYLDFGPGTMTMLHGKERVMTAQEGAAESRGWAALHQEIVGLRSDQRRAQRDQMRAMTVALKNAKALA